MCSSPTVHVFTFALSCCVSVFLIVLNILMDPAVISMPLQ
jgi:hypothetical protein